MQIARMFASLGFNIDTGDLNKFESHLRSVREDLVDFAKFANRSSNAANNMAKNITKLNAALEQNKLAAGTVRYSKAFTAYDKGATKAANRMSEIAITLENNKTGFTALHALLEKGMGDWLKYAENVKLAELSLRSLKGSMLDVRSMSPKGGVRASGGGRGGSRGGSERESGFRNPIPEGFHPFLGGGLDRLSGAVAAGFALKGIIESGRAMQAMDLKIQAVSRSTAEFNNNLAFVRKTSHDLALDINDVGDAYSSIFMSARETKTPEQIQKMFTGFSTYFKALQLSPEAIKGSFLAINQMFNKQKVLAEEFTQQLGERATGVTVIAAKALSITVPEFLKRMQNGKLTTDMLFKISAAMGEAAKAGGALEKSLNNSASAQMQFNNALKEFNKDTLAKIDPVLKGIFRSLVAMKPFFESFRDGLLKAFKTVDAVAEVFKKFTGGLNSNTASALGTIAAWVVIGLTSNMLVGKFGKMVVGLKEIKTFSDLATKSMNGLAIGLLAVGITEFFSSLKDMNESDSGWLLELMSLFDLLMVKIDNAILKMHKLWLSTSVFHGTMSDEQIDALPDPRVVAAQQNRRVQEMTNVLKPEGFLSGYHRLTQQEWANQMGVPVFQQGSKEVHDAYIAELFKQSRANSINGGTIPAMSVEVYVDGKSIGTGTAVPKAGGNKVEIDKLAGGRL